MDTKERNAPVRRRKHNSAGRRTVGHRAPTRQRRRPAPVAKPRREKRVIRAPREDIPEAVYTMPQPFRRGKFLLRLVSVVAVVMALMMAISIFFKVDTVTVLGAEKYTAWMVQEASGIQTGDGLLTLSKARAAGKIRSELAYVDEVKIGIQLPGTVNIEITELDVTYAISALDNTWWLISSDGRVLEQIDSTAASGYTKIIGVQADAPRADQTVTAAADAPVAEATQESDTAEETEQTQSADDVTLPTQAVETNAQRLEAALSILRSLENNGIIGQVASVNVQSLTDIQLQYGQRFQVKLGSADRLDYKVEYMAKAISQMEQYQSGVLDVSFEFREEGIFTPDG